MGRYYNCDRPLPKSFSGSILAGMNLALVSTDDFGASPLIASQTERAALLALWSQLCNQIPLVTHQVRLCRLILNGLTFTECCVISFQFCAS